MCLATMSLQVMPWHLLVPWLSQDLKLTTPPGITATAAAMEDVMNHWRRMPGPVKWCGTSFEEMHLGVCFQMVVNKVHLQKKKGAKGQAWKDFYELTIGIRRVG